MKKLFALVSFVLMFISLAAGQKPQKPVTYAPGEVLVRFKSKATVESRRSLHSAARGTVVRQYRSISNLQRVKLAADANIDDVLALYRANPDVLYAEPNYKLKAQVVPNDTRYGDLWGMNNINAPAAWDESTGSADYVIGVTDTGVDYNHVDLAANIFSNQTECAANGIDDDENGYVDDCHGIDVWNRDSDPMDDNHHGTHVAGTIGAVGNNGVGVAGVVWNTKMVHCKFLNENGDGFSTGALECMDYYSQLKDAGVNIIATNNSWGSVGEINIIEQSNSLRDAILSHLDRGILFVVAAGNGMAGFGFDNDITPRRSDTANHIYPNVIMVAAYESDGDRAMFSNFGRRTVHLGAPGVGVWSTSPTAIAPEGYESLNGTSMATPHVTGAVALLKAWNPALSWIDIKNLLLAGGVNYPSMAGLTVTGKRLDIVGAMNCTDSVVTARMSPRADTELVTPGVPMELSATHINCAEPAGELTVTVTPGGAEITLKDDGAGNDLYAGDGIYSGEWTPEALGSYELEFSNGDTVTVHALEEYVYSETDETYRNITGTSLQLPFFDPVFGFAFFDSRTLTPAFPIRFGGASFEKIHISMKGVITFDMPLSTAFNAANVPFPTSSGNGAMIAPWWANHENESNHSAKNVYYQVLGEAPHRELVIEWRDLYFNDGDDQNPGPVTFQTVFFEDRDDILFGYKDTVAGGGNSFADHGATGTVGIQVARDRATQYSFDNDVLNDGDMVLWTTSATPQTLPNVTAVGGELIVGGSDTQITVTGSGFDANSVVRWHGGPFIGWTLDLPTTFNSSTQLTATVPGNVLGFSGERHVSVRSSETVAQSNAFSVLISPVILSSFSPDTIAAGRSAFDLTINGQNFREGATVRFNDVVLNTTFVNSTQITANVPASSVTTPGTALITVQQGFEVTLAKAITITSFEVTSEAVDDSVNPGQSATYNVSLGSLGEYDQTVSFSCTGLPRGASCTFDPSQLTPGTGSAETELTIRTTGPSASLTAPGQNYLVWLALALPMFGLVASSGATRRVMLTTVLIAGVGLMSACGGGGGGGGTDTGGGGSTSNATPSGTYTVTVRATGGSLVKTTTVTLRVQ